MCVLSYAGRETLNVCTFVMQCTEMVKAFLPLYLEYIAQFDVCFCHIFLVVELMMYYY